MVGKECRENVIVLVRLVGQLNENRRQQVADLLIASIPEVEVEKRNRGQSRLTYVVNLFDDR